EAIGRVTGSTAEIDADTRKISAPVRDRVAALTDVARMIDETGVEAEDIAVRRPTLDEVFLRITGHSTAAETEQAKPPGSASAEGEDDASTRTGRDDKENEGTEEVSAS